MKGGLFDSTRPSPKKTKYNVTKTSRKNFLSARVNKNLSNKNLSNNQKSYSKAHPLL